MTADAAADSAPILEPSTGPRRRRSQARAWRFGFAGAALALLLAIAVDRWLAREFEQDARDEVRLAMAPYASALKTSVERRIAILAGLRSFADTRRSRAVLDEEFPLFAQGLLTGTSGIRALQFVQDGRIAATVPLTGNERALGYDLLADPRPLIGADVRRAMASGAVTVTGPIALVQGGEGLLVRHRITPREGFPDLAAVILDVPTIVAEAGLPAPGTALALEVRDRGGAWFGGDPMGAAASAESLEVEVPDGDWALLGAPRAGWASAIAARQAAARLAALAFVIAAGLLGFVIGGREARLEREITERGTRLDLVLRAARMGIWQWDAATDSVTRSEAARQIVGEDGSDEGVRGATARFLASVHPADRPGLERMLGDLVAGSRDQFVIEYRVLRPDGTSRWVIDVGQLERDAAGDPVRLLGVVSDATERRELEDQLRHSQRLESVGRLAGGVAHDFNNLLTAMIGFTELARDRAAELPAGEASVAIREDLAQVLATAERAALLTGQLLAFSRRQAAEPSALDPSAAMRELEPMLRPLVGGERTLRVELADGLPQILIDRGQLTQVVLNLIVNARDAMPAGGTVTLRTFATSARDAHRHPDAPPGDWVCLEIEDSGVGMDAELQARIFEPYFTTKDVGRGTGLGLAVVYGAVHNAHGHVTVQSRKGVGSTFRVYLPPREDSARSR